MRIVLIGPYSSFKVSEDAEFLRLFNYAVVTHMELREPGYFMNRGAVPNDQQGWDNFTTEILHDAIAVLHPEADAQMHARVAEICRAQRRPLVRLEDVPQLMPDSTELFDGLSIAFDPVVIVVQRRMKPVREVIADIVVMLHEIEAAINARIGWFFTNGRKLADRADGQPAPRPYKLNTTPASATG